MIALYHTFSDPEELGKLDRTNITGKKDIMIIPLDADSRRLVPHPLEASTIKKFKITTIWGMLAYRLGEYDKLKHLDGADKPVPDTDTLKDLVRGKRAIILIDEIAKYAFNMQRSSQTADYGEKVITFIENLAKAVEDTESVLVISLQADYRKGIETTEPIRITDFTPDYQYKEQVDRIIAALRRVSPMIVTPVSYYDYAAVLRKKIFRLIPESTAREVQDELQETYRESPDIFGSENKWHYTTSTRTFSIKDTYPFHPKYLELLFELVTRNRDLQKTRDAINITRKVIRSVVRDEKDPLIIMPFHLNLKNNDIRNNIITENYAPSFDSIITRDIVSGEGFLGNVRFCSNPDIAFTVANTILLKTFTYETFKESLSVFPDVSDISIMVYEPQVFEVMNIIPSDVKDILNDVYSKLNFMLSDGGKYWFSPYPSVKEIVDRLAESQVVNDLPKLYKMLVNAAESILKPSKSKSTKDYEPLVFSGTSPTFIGPGDIVDDVVVEDNDRMKLIIFTKPETHIDEVEKLLRYSGRTPRIRTNTLAAIYPDPHKNIKELILHLAKEDAANTVIENLSEYFPDEDVRNIQQKRLKNYVAENDHAVKDGLLGILTKVAFIGEESLIKVMDAQKSSSIIEQVEKALISAKAGGKIREEIDFEDLRGYIKKVTNIDLVENGNNPLEFRYILDDLFLSRSDAPFVSRSQLEEALKKGLRNFDIAIKQKGRIYWKNIETNESEEPTTISENAEILSYRRAAKEIASNLLQQETRIKKDNDQVIEIGYFVKSGEDEIPLSAVASRSNFEMIIKNNPILKREKLIEEGFDIILDKQYSYVKPRETVIVKFKVELIGGKYHTVSLHTEKGEISPSNGKTPFEGIWHIGSFDKPGKHVCILEAKSDALSREYRVTIEVEGEQKMIEVDSIQSSMEGFRLTQIRPNNIHSFRLASDTFDKLNIESNADAKVTIDKKVFLEVSDMNVTLCSFLLQRFYEFNERYGSLFDRFEYYGTIDLVDPVILDQRVISAIQNINKKAKFLVQATEENE